MVRNERPPLLPPTIFIDVGSPTITARGSGKLSTTSLIRWRTPTHPTSSSNEKAKCIGTLRSRDFISGAIARAIAQKPFISDVPRPKSFPDSCDILKGALVHSCPSIGTTSVWPDRTTPPISCGPIVHQRFAFVLSLSCVSLVGTPNSFIYFSISEIRSKLLSREVVSNAMRRSSHSIERFKIISIVENPFG